jgi:hypothetical protein
MKTITIKRKIKMMSDPLLLNLDRAHNLNPNQF